MKNHEKMFYGRARRVALAQRIVGGIAIVLVLVVSIYFISTKVSLFDRNVEFSYLINYFEKRGYSCQMLHKSGGSCTNNKGATKYTFVRYDNGFNYFVKNDSYNLEIKHVSDVDDVITFRTNDTAFVGFRNKYYYCTTDNSVFGNLKECVTKDGDKLESDAYIGVVEQGIKDINSIVKASGYESDALINDYAWTKK